MFGARGERFQPHRAQRAASVQHFEYRGGPALEGEFGRLRAALRGIEQRRVVALEPVGGRGEVGGGAPDVVAGTERSEIDRSEATCPKGATSVSL